MSMFQSFTHFIGFDWASKHHDVAVVDREGKIVAQFRFENTSEGWSQFRQRIQPYACSAVAIETSSGSDVDRLLEAELAVFPVQPKAAKAYRTRKAPSGVKDDQLDAWSLADALRTDGKDWRQLKPEDPLTMELRLLCRDEKGLVEERTAKIIQLRAALHDYYPLALEVFDDWTQPCAWRFVEKFPTPEKLKRAGKSRWKKFFKRSRMHSQKKNEARMALFAKADEFCGSPAMVAAKSLLAQSIVKVLGSLEEQLEIYRKRIGELYEQHPDRDWFGSLPISQDGKTAPRLLSELGTDRDRFESPGSLQCHAGAAPVRFQTGQHKKGKVRIRLACNKYMRYAFHWFSDLSRAKTPWAEAYYQKKRDEGHSHASALRCLAKIWAKILWRMWQDRKPYDPDYHQRNQLKHGSWVLKLTQT